jgi:hypothetical protein
VPQAQRAGDVDVHDYRAPTQTGDHTNANEGLRSGTRVRILGDIVATTLRDPRGVVVRPDVYDGYYVIHLDVPAIYHRADGSTEELEEIVESHDNLAILDPAA